MCGCNARKFVLFTKWYLQCDLCIGAINFGHFIRYIICIIVHPFFGIYMVNSFPHLCYWFIYKNIDYWTYLSTHIAYWTYFIPSHLCSLWNIVFFHFYTIFIQSHWHGDLNKHTCFVFSSLLIYNKVYMA